MGKNFLQKHSKISSENKGHAGCAWSMFHIMKYNQWRHVMKRLTYKKTGGDNRHLEVVGNPGNDTITNASSANKLDEQVDAKMDNSIADQEKKEESSQTNDSSMDARIAALVAEEVSKIMKGQQNHRTSSAYPVRSLKRSFSIHHRLEPKVLEPLDKIINDSSPKIIHQDPFSNLDSPPKNSSEEPVKDISSYGDESGNIVASDQVDKHEKKSLENQAVLEENLDHTIQDVLKQPNLDPSLFKSKELLDALDMISANKELLLKILHEPDSPLAQYFHKQHALNTKLGLTKSDSFPLNGTLGRKGLEPNKLEPNHEGSGSENHSQEQNFANSSSPIHPQLLKGENPAAIKRFKDLKQKIKHVIEDSKKERRRISMDAILHKVPHGQKLSDQELEEIDNQLEDTVNNRGDKSNARSGYERACSAPSFKHKQARHMRRTSSLNESMDRYCQLYENSFNQEAKQQSSQSSDNLKVRTIEAGSPVNTVPKNLGRILSMPDLKAYICYSQESSCAFSSATPSRSDFDPNVSARTSFNERSSLDDLYSLIRENSEEVDEISSIASELANFLDRQDNLSKQGQEPTSMVNNPQAFESEHGIENEEPPKSDLIYDMTDLKLDENNKVEFSYVRDVLELSGFSGSGFLGSWHSEDQPVDPLVYEAVEGCLFLDPDCSGNEGGKCDHLLMFDLINEVLMEIYGRSYSYYPMPLTSLSHIRPMPVGHHVLEQVWGLISFYLRLRPELDQSLDYVVNVDLAKDDGWMNLQFDTECVALEVEDMVFDDLLDELVYEDLLEEEM
ncbi:uncharacterized protein LOC112493237 [Ziziphus jujuba]|uniref:Uncharacterized protein LOC112493237 n=1 Tax=Ziziphus jujuba TaxID=326968 RepID=A0A6P6GJX3_ZIZJJ|nr:uncharacterized protein LOC112493237 [Ziziphus jujuba]XP_060669636.1 uncharacterized protein LOC112493237 [Ziziphus jujuba]